MDEGRQRPGEAGVAGERDAHEELSLATDVEQADPEAEGDAEAGGDQRRTEAQRFGEGSDRPSKVSRVRVEDRAAEQCSVAVDDGTPGGRDGVHRPGEEVPGDARDIFTGRGDQDRADNEPAQDGEDSADDAAAHDLVQDLARYGSFCGLGARFFVDLRNEVLGHAAIPAIISPRVARGVSAATIPIIRPRYMTAMRSASPTTSSSSVETIRTGNPESRVAMMRSWTKIGRASC